MSVKTLESCFHECTDKEISNFVDTVKDKIRNAILTAIDSIITPKIETLIRSKNASSGQDATSFKANSEQEGHIGFTAPSENLLERNTTLH